MRSKFRAKQVVESYVLKFTNSFVRKFYHGEHINIYGVLCEINIFMVRRVVE